LLTGHFTQNPCRGHFECNEIFRQPRAITLIDPAVRGRHDELQRHASFEYIFEQSRSQEEVIPTAGWGMIRSELTAASTPDQAHAFQMMTEVHTVSIVPKKMYDANICSCQAPLAKG